MANRFAGQSLESIIGNELFDLLFSGAVSDAEDRAEELRGVRTKRAKGVRLIAERARHMRSRMLELVAAMEPQERKD